jgi:hypothetical protein
MMPGREHGEKYHVKVGNVQFSQSVTAKLLGMETDKDQK